MNIITYVSYTYLIKRIYQNLTHTPKNIYISFLLQNIKISTWERETEISSIFTIFWCFSTFQQWMGGICHRGASFNLPTMFGAILMSSNAPQLRFIWQGVQITRKKRMFWCHWQCWSQHGQRLNLHMFLYAKFEK